MFKPQYAQQSTPASQQLATLATCSLWVLVAVSSAVLASTAKALIAFPIWVLQLELANAATCLCRLARFALRLKKQLALCLAPLCSLKSISPATTILAKICLHPLRLAASVETFGESEFRNLVDIILISWIQQLWRESRLLPRSMRRSLSGLRSYPCNFGFYGMYVSLQTFGKGHHCKKGHSREIICRLFCAHRMH